MASYVGDSYQYDVFISYAASPPPIKSYAEAIYEELTDQLPYVIGVTGSGPDVKRPASPSIYFDRDSGGKNELHAADHLPDAIKSILNSSATFVMLWSPWYCTSDYCKLERAHWLSAKRATPSATIAPEMRRTFIPVWLEFKPDENLHAYDLEKIAEEYFDGLYRPVAVDFSDPATRAPVGLHAPKACLTFKKRVANLASSLAQTLWQLKEHQLNSSDHLLRSPSEITKTVKRLSRGQGLSSPTYRGGPSTDAYDEKNEKMSGRGIDLGPEPAPSQKSDQNAEKPSPSELRGIHLTDESARKNMK
jgi:hypothetical protein